MKTDDLIAALAADTAHRPRSTGVSLLLALGLGGLISAVLFLALLGVRGDIAAALATWRFDLKLALLAGATIVAARECYRLARPTERGGSTLWPLLIVALLAAAVGIELASTPRTEWAARLVGTNALLCLSVIPALAAVPFVVIMWAMRTGAPMSPGRAGLAVGVLSAAVASLLYATHCFDDSPLFVATWYPLATLMLAVAGAFVGRLALRW